MKAMILDPVVTQQVLARRRALGQDRWDEVWDGVWVMAPSPNKDHQLIVMRLAPILDEAVHGAGLGDVFMQFNVADPVSALQDFRIPDVSVVLNQSSAVVHQTYIAGGPDLAIDVRSPGDETEQKVPWYARQGVRELLVIDRDSLAMQLFRRAGDELVQVPAVDDGAESQLIPVGFRRNAGAPKALIVYELGNRGRTWRILV